MANAESDDRHLTPEDLQELLDEETCNALGYAGSILQNPSTFRSDRDNEYRCTQLDRATRVLEVVPKLARGVLRLREVELQRDEMTRRFNELLKRTTDYREAEREHEEATSDASRTFHHGESEEEAEETAALERRAADKMSDTCDALDNLLKQERGKGRKTGGTPTPAELAAAVQKERAARDAAEDADNVVRGFNAALARGETVPLRKRTAALEQREKALTAHDAALKATNAAFLAVGAPCTTA